MTNKPSWQDEFVKISKEPLFPTAPHCPFCDYKSDFNAKTGIHRHVKTKHPNHSNTRMQVQLAFIQDLLDRKAREIEGLKQKTFCPWKHSADDVDDVMMCEGCQGARKALDQAISILKEK